ncbi:MAG: hypothetical protein SGI86_01755 [Deltaproteobacteria bacterium]|nr:hypothetical protein [Deltaproteobacteria bacterium]
MNTLFAVLAVVAADMPAPTLSAPALTERQASSFVGADGKASAFWQGLNTAPTVMRPSTHTNRDGRDEFRGDKDAEVALRAAHSDKGLYLLIEVRDDEWSPVFKASGYPHAYDALEIMFDSHSSQQISACGQKCRPAALAKWDLTDKTRQLQFWTDPRIDALKFLYSEPDFFPGHEMKFAQVTRDHDGLTVDRFSAGRTVRTAEIFVPWAQLGIDARSQKPGSRFAFTVSYHDNDTRRDNPYMINTLRFANHGNPFSGAGYWGDIMLTGPAVVQLAPM